MTTEEIHLRHIRTVEAQIEGFVSAITAIATNWKPEVSALVSKIEEQAVRSRLRALRDLAVQLTLQLEDLGYTKLSRKIVKNYDAITESTLQVTATFDRPKEIPVNLHRTILQQAKTLDMSAYQNIGATAVRELAKGITTDVVVGLPKKRIVENIKATIDTKLNRYAGTYVETATRQFDRTVSTAIYEEAGTEKFKYRGPNDKLTRKWCKGHVGKVYTLEEIKAMENGQGLPVLTNGGGWNCRHRWSPVQE